MDMLAQLQLWLSRPVFHWARKALPALSDTEREALEAGDTWWDAELFTGDPKWSTLRGLPAGELSEEESRYLEGPTEQLCEMLNDWRVNWELGDLPPEAWRFIKENRFFGMIIPKEYGGLGFSAFAHSQVIRKIATRSVSAAVTVMVPNSLGPGELLMRFGTKEQQRRWLPRFADGREIPCFALTSPEAGSDAASMVDSGVVCRQTHDGRETIGLRLNWRKRYITLGPIATIIGLAFKAYDPERLIGDREELGVTLALVPVDAPGVEIGRRHLPAYQMFQNGPNAGCDVFIPIDNVIGGVEMIGQGWAMLMNALAAGRGISLPALSAAGAALAARATGAYARVREQFDVPIGKFEGVEEALSRIAGTAYVLDAARRLTCVALDQGRHPAVISAIMKYHATERMRLAVNDAMDVHGGKAIMDGPHNYLGNLYRAVPIGITVEGANILTRSLIIFGQGAIRSHPYLFEEMLALTDDDRENGARRFAGLFWRHVSHDARTFARAWWRSWTRGAFTAAPEAGAATRFYKALAAYAAGFALVSEAALLTQGATLKRRETLSARLGDILSELYFASAALWRWEDEGRQEADAAILEWCMEDSFRTIETRFAQIFANPPNRLVFPVLRLLVQPFGLRRHGPGDALSRRCAQSLLAPSATRDRLTSGIFIGSDDNGLARLEHAFALVIETAEVSDRLRKANLADLDAARDRRLLTPSEYARMIEMHEALAAVINVDDFAPDAFRR